MNSRKLLGPIPVTVILIIIITVLSTPGCDNGGDDVVDVTEHRQKQKTTKVKPDYTIYRIRGRYVYEFRLKDGTRCISSTDGGLVCNFK